MTQRLPLASAGDDPRAVPDQPVEVLDVEEHLTLGDRLADKVAAFGGSWKFMFCFAGILLLWVLLNSGILAHWQREFDPYPYILLNLFLSMLAAIQAPVIMMSQNRQAAKDRVQAEHDYQINQRAELEIAGLHDKLDRMRDLRLAEALLRIERRLDEADLLAPATPPETCRPLPGGPPRLHERAGDYETVTSSSGRGQRLVAMDSADPPMRRIDHVPAPAAPVAPRYGLGPPPIGRR